MIETIKNLPDSAGIYQYFNEKGQLLYIGKAKNLKNRVKSYWNFTPTLRPNQAQSPRILRENRRIDRSRKSSRVVISKSTGI